MLYFKYTNLKEFTQADFLLHGISLSVNSLVWTSVIKITAFWCPIPILNIYNKYKVGYRFSVIKCSEAKAQSNITDLQSFNL